MGTPDVGEMVDAAVRQVHDAVSKIDLDGIVAGVGKAFGDVAHAFGVGRREPSPYIICDQDVDRRVRGQYIHCGILLIVALGFLDGIVATGEPVEGVICLVLGILHGYWGVGHLLKGRHERRLADVLSIIAERLGTRERISMTELAVLVDVSTMELESLLGEAIDRGLIPEGRLDAPLGKRMLYLTDAAWEADGALEEASEAAEGQQVIASDEDSHHLPEDARKVVDACLSFSIEALGIRKVMADAEVCSSLDGIVSKVRRLADYVERHPETASQLRKLTTYYLPTTIKLASAYAELESQGEGPEAASMRTDVKDTLSLVDDALTRLSDNLMQDQAWDLRSDMDVMRQQLEQDGLSGGA